MTPGTGLLASLDEALVSAAEIGYPTEKYCGRWRDWLTRRDDEQSLKDAMKV